MLVARTCKRLARESRKKMPPKKNESWSVPILPSLIQVSIDRRCPPETFRTKRTPGSKVIRPDTVLVKKRVFCDS